MITWVRLFKGVYYQARRKYKSMLRSVYQVQAMEPRWEQDLRETGFFCMRIKLAEVCSFISCS